MEALEVMCLKPVKDTAIRLHQGAIIHPHMTSIETTREEVGVTEIGQEGHIVEVIDYFHSSLILPHRPNF
jgi:hypothetical protein